MDQSSLNDAFAIWDKYRGLIPKNYLLPLLELNRECRRIDMLCNKIKMNQWTDEKLSEDVYDDFITSVFRWRDIVTMDILKNGYF